MNKDLTIFIKHILDSIKSIESFSKGVSKSDFMKDDLKASAIIRKLEIIGEAAKNISSEFRKKYPKIEWKEIAGLRDKLIHHYFGVNLERVWNVVKDDIPKLKKQISEILKDSEEASN